METLEIIINDFHSEEEIKEEARRSGLKGRELKEFLDKLKWANL